MSSEARDRAVSAVGDQTVARHVGTSSRRLSSLAVVVGALILLLVLASLTPPGRAVAGDIGDFIGITEGDSEPSSVVPECPESIGGADKAGCQLFANAEPLQECPKPPVGADVRVAGFSCRAAYELLNPLGSAGTGSIKFHRSSQLFYRPSIGLRDSSSAQYDTGWSCWRSYERNSPSGIQFVCWRGDSLLSFKFFG